MLINTAAQTQASEASVHSAYFHTVIFTGPEHWTHVSEHFSRGNSSSVWHFKLLTLLYLSLERFICCCWQAAGQCPASSFMATLCWVENLQQTAKPRTWSLS